MRRFVSFPLFNLSESENLYILTKQIGIVKTMWRYDAKEITAITSDELMN